MATEHLRLPQSDFLDFAKLTMPNLAEQFAIVARKPGGPHGSYPNFWQLGCAFDTILDYFAAIRDYQGLLLPPDKDILTGIMEQAKTGYQWGIVGAQANWYDDWCWWGIAASKAFDARYEDLFSPEDLRFFRSAALDLWGLVDFGDYRTMADSIPAEIWDSSGYTPGKDSIRFTKDMFIARAELHKGTRHTWTRIEGGAAGCGTERQNRDFIAFTANDENWAVPRFAGGCWQYDFSFEAFPKGDGQSWFWPDPRPAKQALGVYQLTLMQGLYLSFCCSLAAAARRKADEGKSGEGWDRLQPVQAYLQPAEEVVGFLASWMDGTGTDSLASNDAAGTLLHERVATYAKKPDGTYGTVTSYVPDFFWSGDQGLIMGALMQYAALIGPDTPDQPAAPVYRLYPAKILSGVFQRIPTSDQTDPPELPGAVGPYLPPTQPIGGDKDDYGSGSGIFWRYVARCCRIDPRFGDEVRNNQAMATIATVSGTNLNNWGNPLFEQFNTVAAAVGAWHLLDMPR
jgi:hypothetical protein